jgi:hypothetical protein
MSTQHLNASWPKLRNAAPPGFGTKDYGVATVAAVNHHIGVTNWSFFHHFNAKDKRAVDAIEHWNGLTGGFFTTASYHEAEGTIDRLLGCIDFRTTSLNGGKFNYPACLSR